MSFVHLHVHTEYSMLDGLIRMGDLFETAAAQGAPAVAVTDHGDLMGMWQAAKHAKRTGVSLIPGLEAYVAIGSRHDRDKIFVTKDDGASEGDADSAAQKSATKSRTYEHLTILARNRAGWHNLVRLQNESSKNTSGRAKLIDYDLLAEHGEGLMVLTGCIGGPVFGPLSRAMDAEAQMRALMLPGTDELDPITVGAEYTMALKIFNALSSQEDCDESSLRDAESEMDRRHEELTAMLAPGSTVLAVAELASQVDYERHRARTNVEKLIAAVGKENVYVEVMDHGNEDERATLPALRALAEEYELMVVATNDAHHTKDEDRVAHAAWLAVRTKSTLDNPKFSFHGTGYHLRDAAEMEALVDEDWWTQACRNTLLVAERVDADIMPAPQIRLPKFPVPEGFERDTQYLRHLLNIGIERHFPSGLGLTERARLNEELSVIVSMGFVDYFLIVEEMISWARSQNFLVGPGRGSAAGSFVAYLLGITQVNPITYGLLFERFLEPGRAELPDIDVDFESRHKQAVLLHLAELWGEDCVAQIGSVGRPLIRGAWKAAMRVLGEPTSVTDRLSKLIPSDLTAVELIAGSDDPRLTEFWAAANKIAHIDQVLTLLQEFYEVSDKQGIHASGVIISPEPLTDLIPMRWAKPGSSDRFRWVTEWDHHDIEEFGLVKFDVLAIRNLDMADIAMELVEQFNGEHLDLYGLPDPDIHQNDARVQKTFEMLRDGRTAGVFQLEGAAMTRLLEDVAPDTLEELSAVVALFRPGPLSAGMHTKYADRKHGREVVSYDYLTSNPVEAQWLDKVMGKTYGVFVYQEQIMQLGRVVAGFDDVWRSKLRKAVSKKNEQLMIEVGGRFMRDAEQEFRSPDDELISPVFSRQTAERVWDAMRGSAEYLFNKSHSIAYALVAYYTAYLKANYPGHYGAATLSVTGADKKDKRLAAMRALLGEGMEILPPDVNISSFATLPDGTDAVRIGLAEIKGFGDVAEDLIRERERGGIFTSLADLLTRVTTGEASKPLATNRVDALIESGACDAFGPRMGMRFAARALTQPGAIIPDMEYASVELGVRQADRLLMTLDTRVRDDIQSALSSWVHPSTHEGGFHAPTAIPVGELNGMDFTDGSIVYVSGVLAAFEEKAYSKGVLARIEIQDASGSLEGVMWEQDRAQAKESGSIPQTGFPVVLYGKVATRSFTLYSVDENDQEVEEEVTRREITVRGIYPIPVDLTPSGGMPGSSFPRIDFTLAQKAPEPAGDAQSVFVTETVDGTPPEFPSTSRTQADPSLSPSSTYTAGATQGGPSLPAPHSAPRMQGALALVPMIAGEAIVTETVPETRHPVPYLQAVPALTADHEPVAIERVDEVAPQMPARPQQVESALPASTPASAAVPAPDGQSLAALFGLE
ncbi:DNA polymerase III subunit alpha [Leucobacter sp. cx-169]|uniref:DNA polymerase III subunit alpha n=1 Tax=Leucobacter sp. cx-169 TaxID=2770549 RepID=UPI00165D7116|nr:DNA polymerase III subunit alpha [Leucobacter sp. cx-169]